MISLAMTPAQFAKVRTYIAAAPKPEIAAFTADSPTTGSFRTSQVALSYSYDGTALLSVTVDAKFGMAKFVPESEIGSRLQGLLSKV